MLRHTKIVATLGPATDDPAVLADMLKEGLDVARVNFSHGDREDHRRRMGAVRACAESSGRSVGLLADLQGSKVRIESFRDGRVTLRDGARFFLDAGLAEGEGSEERVGVTYRQLAADVNRGDTLLLDDGRIVLWVEHVAGDEIETRVVVGGELSDHKGINRQGGGLSAAVLTDKDRQDIRLAGELGADYLGVSFVRTARDVEVARELFRAAGGEGGIIAKIERAEAMTNSDEIIEAADGVMIARGDLGVEIGDAELPGVQKRIIREARARNRLVITATQMMQSMVESSQPTRAEVLDVANAVLDGTDAVMLSAETAVGRHPVKVVAAMDRICRGAERHHGTIPSTERVGLQFSDTEEAIAMATMYTAEHYDIAAILALTESGATAKWMSRHISGIPIYAVTRHVRTQRRVTLFRGVFPVSYSNDALEDQPVDREVLGELVRRGTLRSNERIIITKGDIAGLAGGTNSMKIVRVGDT